MTGLRVSEAASAAPELVLHERGGAAGCAREVRLEGDELCDPGFPGGDRRRPRSGRPRRGHDLVERCRAHGRARAPGVRQLCRTRGRGECPAASGAEKATTCSGSTFVVSVGAERVVPSPVPPVEVWIGLVVSTPPYETIMPEACAWLEYCQVQEPGRSRWRLGGRRPGRGGAAVVASDERPAGGRSDGLVRAAGDGDLGEQQVTGAARTGGSARAVGRLPAFPTAIAAATIAGSITYGTGNVESSSLSSTFQSPLSFFSFQASPAGVMFGARRVRIATGRSRRSAPPVSRRTRCRRQGSTWA